MIVQANFPKLGALQLTFIHVTRRNIMMNKIEMIFTIVLHENTHHAFEGMQTLIPQLLLSYNVTHQGFKFQPKQTLIPWSTPVGY
jgi:hypothetical protein